jgi:hypothetical protein
MWTLEGLLRLRREKMERRRESHQYYQDTPTCSCGQILITRGEQRDKECTQCNYGVDVKEER